MKNLTEPTWWTLIRDLTEEVYRALRALRRDRRHGVKQAGVPLRAGETLAGALPPFWFGQAGPLACLVRHHYNPASRPSARILIEFRLGPPDTDPVTQETRWAWTLEMWAHLPQTRWSTRTSSETRIAGPCPRVGIHFIADPDNEPLRGIDEWPTKMHVNWHATHQYVRAAEREHLRKLTRGEPLARAALVAQPLPIDPRATPKEVTWVHILLCLWQRQFIELGPQASPEAWAFLKHFFRVRDLSERAERNERGQSRDDDAKLFTLLARLRDHYIMPEDWRGLRKYAKQVLKTGGADPGRR